jgi:peptidyl-prolyl cis-trans isomerase SurA
MPALRLLRIDAAISNRRPRGCLTVALAIAFIIPMRAQRVPSASSNRPVVTLDRIVAVVNRQAILLSDIEDEFRLSVLDPSQTVTSAMTPQRALQQLIRRTLIQQQIREGDIQTANPTSEEVVARLKEIRNVIPACARVDCSSETGWNAFLANHALTPERVSSYVRTRLEILRFIEMRFRQGIRIAPEEVESYYREKLLPQYAPGQAPPSLNQVAPRIEEILLQQQVNVLFNDWLDNLEKQGEIEILDPTLATSRVPNQQDAPALVAPAPESRGGRPGATAQ